MATYSIPVNQTTLTQFMVEVTTEQGEDYAYFLFMDPNEGDHPGTTAMYWCNQDEIENGSNDRADDYYIEEYGVFDNPNCNTEDFINECLQRYQGDGVKIVGDRIEVDNLEYSFIPGSYDLDGYETIEEWAEDNGIDLIEIVQN